VLPKLSNRRRWQPVSIRLLLPLDEGHAVINGHEDGVDPGVVLAEGAEALEGCSALGPVLAVLVQLDLSGDSHATGEDYEIKRSAFECEEQCGLHSYRCRT
jgi:hypothetical protein